MRSASVPNPRHPGKAFFSAATAPLRFADCAKTAAISGNRVLSLFSISRWQAGNPGCPMSNPNNQGASERPIADTETHYRGANTQILRPWGGTYGSKLNE